jgi:hypothetical protein
MNKIQVKFYSKLNADALEYVPIFHRWIRDRELDELLIDVADYSHVKHGPDVVLIGHESDYALDRAMGRLGLLYAQKRPRHSDAGDPWLTALERALKAALKLERETSPTVGLTFRTDEFTLRVADRLLAPNTDATFQRLRPEIERALRVLFGPAPVALSRSGDERELFSVDVKVPVAPALPELVARIAQTPS